MFGNYFYNQHIRKTVAAFGSLFNDIYVLRKDSSGQVLSQMRVPLSYAPKRKYLSRLAETLDGEDAERALAVKLPRMSFEIVALNYDPSFQLPKTNKARCGTYITSDGTKRIPIYSPVIYNLQFQVNVYSKNQDDALQVVEQILPFFSPQYTLSVKPFDGIDDVVDDIPITLEGVTFVDDFEGTVEQRRTIIYTLEFALKVKFRGPVNGDGDAIIREVNGVLYNQATNERMSRVTVTPDPIDVHPDSDFGFNTTITLGYLDSDTRFDL